MPNSYEHSYQHDLDNVIDASDAVLAIGAEKVDTTTLKDRSPNNNDATIHGAMPSSGYFDGGRIFDGVEDYLEIQDNPSLYPTNNLELICVLRPTNIGQLWQELIQKSQRTLYRLRSKKNEYVEFAVRLDDTLDYSVKFTGPDNNNMTTGEISILHGSFNGNLIRIYLNGILQQTENAVGTVNNIAGKLLIGTYLTEAYNGVIYTAIVSITPIDPVEIFNTIARLPLYSHNFTQYPNSDTSLTSVFPYTSGIITSGSFNKTDGLKCTSAGQIIFSNSFEFDGSEYITLTIDGIEYSGTTTVTQGTITTTIAQGSNDIIIDMGTNDVLENIRIQFREEV